MQETAGCGTRVAAVTVMREGAVEGKGSEGKVQREGRGEGATVEQKGSGM